MEKLPPVHTRLARGQTLFLYAQQGTRLVSALGSVSIASPGMWLGERMVSRAMLLNEGDSYLFRAGGWVEISARNPAEVVCTGCQRLAGIVDRLRNIFYRHGDAWTNAIKRRRA